MTPTSWPPPAPPVLQLPIMSGEHLRRLIVMADRLDLYLDSQQLIGWFDYCAGSTDEVPT